jgi:hypothetical protein
VTDETDQPGRDQPDRDLPVLGLVLQGRGEELIPLLSALRRWCRPVLLRRFEGPVAALLLDHLPDEEPNLPWRTVTRDHDVLAVAGERAFWAPDTATSPDAGFVPPFVRARLRAARGLPECPVLGPDRRWLSAQAPPVPDELFDTALACAAVAVAHDPTTAERALAWGTPTVCDLRTAEALGVPRPPDGSDGVVAVEEDPLALAADPRRAAAFSWRGRRWWEDRHDPASLAARIAIDLLPSTPDAAQLRLAELATPSDAEVRTRLRAAMSG